MALDFLDIEGQMPLILNDNPHERSPLLHITSSSSESSISVSTTSSTGAGAPENVEVTETQQKNNVAAVISLLLIGM